MGSLEAGVAESYTFGKLNLPTVINAHCYGKTPTEYVGDKCKLQVLGNPGCVNAKSLHKCGEHPLAVPTYTLSTCICNEYFGLVDRHLLPLIKPSRAYLNFSKKLLLSLFRRARKVQPMSREQLYKTRSTHVKKRWKRAYNDHTPVERKDAYVKSFVKFEKYQQLGKSPRIIQGRSPKYTFNLARYLVPIEHSVYSLKDPLNKFCRIFAKGRNAIQRADDLINMQKFNKNRFLCIDHSRFDSRVGKEHLGLCHWFYQLFIKDSELERLLKMQIKNVGFSRHGLFYKCIGRRMSGDIDTGLGNSIINYTVLRYILRKIDAVIYLDGDDSVVCFDEVDKVRVEKALGMLNETGFESTWNFVDKIEDVEFCQAKILPRLGGYILARNPIRAISRMCYSLNKPDAEYFSTVCAGEMHSSSGVPIIYDFAKANAGPINYERLEYRHKLNLGIKPVNPFDAARVEQALQWEDSTGSPLMIGRDVLSL